MKRSYSIRLDEGQVEKMLSRTGLTFSESLAALLESFVKGEPLSVVVAREGLYIVTYEQVAIPEIDNRE